VKDSGTGETVLAFEHVSKHYPPPPPMRLRRFFARFRGLHIEDGFAADALSGQELDEDDEMLNDDVEGDPVPAAVADGRRVLDDVSLHMRAGSLVALIGPPGGGKSVLLKLAAGIVAPSEGRVVTRGFVAPALTFMQLVLPSKGHTVKGALPQLASMVGISPAFVRSRFDSIAELVDNPQLLRTSTAFMDSRQKRELILAMAVSLEPDVLLLDTQLQRTPFGERCGARIRELCDRGSLVVAEMRNVRKSPVLEPDRAIALAAGRLVDPAPWTPPEARHLLDGVHHD
jgi:ABC-type polysaccharide/polyol phosphate transport system ATPase subunit